MEFDGGLELFSKQVPCRQAQITTLLELFGQREDIACPSIFIYGHTATGKSSTVNTILQSLKLPHVVVNCEEGYSPRSLYESLLNEVSGTVPVASNGFQNYKDCENMNDFIRYLRNAIECRQLDDQTVYIVLDNVENMRQMDDTVLAAFLRLQELVRMNVCVILISRIIWDKYRISSGMHEPFILHFPNYSGEEIDTILMKDRPPHFTEEFYGTYIHLVRSTFFPVCRNLTEIKYMVKQNFSKYCQPILDGEATESCSHKLWKNIESHLRKCLQSVYSRDVTWDLKSPILVPTEPTKTGAGVQLPYYSMYLLIAAYLASYNPAKTDGRFFLKKHEKIGRRAKLNSMKKNKAVNHLLGPKPFLLARLLAIFFSIVDEDVLPTADIFSQVSSLVTLNFLARYGQECLDSPKYVCLVSLDFIRSIAGSLDFDVTKYLYDFV